MTRRRLQPKSGGERAALSRRFAKFKVSWQSRQRLECGGFSTALAPRFMTRVGVRASVEFNCFARRRNGGLLSVAPRAFLDFVL